MAVATKEIQQRVGESSAVVCAKKVLEGVMGGAEMRAFDRGRQGKIISSKGMVEIYRANDVTTLVTVESFGPESSGRQFLNPRVLPNKEPEGGIIIEDDFSLYRVKIPEKGEIVFQR